ncbi:TetR/AcrR family transcriptional regulator [Vibrio rhizosphaerae]|uniref:TetR/AcrR family transcriptional regulator n=1 Tax=Vibrio rhizosphaerae TaxID=398736 RepID=A0ABU4IRE6_9VIBR|nr:TetR/AcrR family transcriptional regulator [Vibrio rhizosphaerae]MDW6091677.1 TetR/AcrR family transcriptional regulator [Vibrio rhizosphaerae]
MHHHPKVTQIVQNGLQLLNDQGSQGLTMRKVANSCGISLGNLQYHFKDRDSLLKGMIDFYLQQFIQLTQSVIPQFPNKDKIQQQDIEEMILSILNNTMMEESCRIFREFWAIASRDKTVEDYLHHYSLQCSNMIATIFTPLAPNKPILIQSIISLLLPYFEGYTLTYKAIPFRDEQVAELLGRVIFQLIQE